MNDLTCPQCGPSAEIALTDTVPRVFTSWRLEAGRVVYNPEQQCMCWDGCSPVQAVCLGCNQALDVPCEEKDG